MKLLIKNTLALIALTTFSISCSSDDNSAIVNGTRGEAELFFDNAIIDNDLELNTAYTNSNNESIKVSRLNYIVSNFVLIQADGTEMVYTEEDNYFIINEVTGQTTVHLEDIPAGDYTSVRFGLGVDRERYAQGEAAQQTFWNNAITNFLGQEWADGYRFINFEGTFTSPQIQGEKNFRIYQGSSANDDNYREITLQLPNTARVRANEAPSIHIIADANSILDGIEKIKLSQAVNTAGTAAEITAGAKLVTIAANTRSMFRVDHVHNGEGHHEE